MPEGYQLAIESSATRASVALGRDGEIVVSTEREAGRRQSEVLMEPLEEVLARLEGGEIALVVVGTGPGSYNGARVGIAAGQGISLVHGCPTVGLCSLEGVAPVRSGAPCLALGDARRATFFTLKLGAGKLSANPELLEHSDFVQQVATAAAEGTHLITLEEPRRLNLPAEIEQKVERVVPSAELLLEAWWAKSESERGDLLRIPPQPFYLRAPHITTPS